MGSATGGEQSAGCCGFLASDQVDEWTSREVVQLHRLGQVDQLPNVFLTERNNRQNAGRLDYTS